MIEINLDSKDRKNNKIIIDGENICQKYKVTGFNLKSDSDYNFCVPILTVDIWDDDIKVISDKDETIINKRYICDNAFYVIKSDNCWGDISEFITSIQYDNFEEGKPQQVKVAIDYRKFKTNKDISFLTLEIGEKIQICSDYKLQYNGLIMKLTVPTNEDLIYITCKLHQ
jgi:hypothetical protein